MPLKLVTHVIAVGAGVLLALGGVAAASPPSNPTVDARLNPCAARTLEGRVACLERLLTNTVGRPRPMSVLESREAVRSWCDGLRYQQRDNQVGGALNQLIENLRIGCRLAP